MFYLAFDFAMAVIMLLLGCCFYKSKGKAAGFLSGYNMKPEAERKKYDEDAMTLQEVSKILGHTNTSVTERCYVEFRKHGLNKARMVMNTIYSVCDYL